MTYRSTTPFWLDDINLPTDPDSSFDDDDDDLNELDTSLSTVNIAPPKEETIRKPFISPFFSERLPPGVSLEMSEELKKMIATEEWKARALQENFGLFNVDAHLSRRSKKATAPTCKTTEAHFPAHAVNVSGKRLRLK